MCVVVIIVSSSSWSSEVIEVLVRSSSNNSSSGVVVVVVSYTPGTKYIGGYRLCLCLSAVCKLFLSRFRSNYLTKDSEILHKP